MIDLDCKVWDYVFVMAKGLNESIIFQVNNCFADTKTQKMMIDEVLSPRRYKICKKY
jgi:hypothetical protein